ncbi:heavy-metal-associated domain-containing protein [Roseomonas populi]|uniref:Heavy-metal-associated domain-containing protein n=1 Tax=Roseomonas populi TaxID=3121582 RepID=A0ABT1X7R1_9PROT|nr:heavy-metal-associated domain-containing protein [Roseomonas pecuniae]MCR0984145.1 heavy-metal-associated domain-containing protein [Roseomonas pecuniae]
MHFIVENMHCEGCAKGVTAAVKQADPSAQVEVRLEDRSISVNGGRLGGEALRSALQDAGWKAAATPS